MIHYDNRDVGLSQRMDGAPAGSLVWAMLASRFGLPVKTAYSLTDMATDAALTVILVTPVIGLRDLMAPFISVRVERSRDTRKARTPSWHLDCARCERFWVGYV